MVGVGVAHRHNDFARLDVEASAPKRLVQPKLLKGHFATLLSLGLIFARFLGLHLHSRFIAAVLKFDLRAQRPAVAKVVAQVERDVRQVKTPVARIVAIAFGRIIAVETLTVEVARHHRLAIAAQAQTIS